MSKRFVACGSAVVALAAAISFLAAAVACWRVADVEDDLNAVIVDQLATTDPNPAFVSDATKELELSGYEVEYVAAGEVTVDFYRNLGEQGYELIILRSHSTGSLEFRLTSVGSGAPETATRTLRTVQLFTNEPYSADEHVSNQLALDLTRVRYEAGRKEGLFFGITPRFVSNVMRGNFHGSVVLLMGCDGLSSNDLAAAFIGRGAESFVGWNGEVTARHTDRASLSLVRRLAQSGSDVEQAVAATNRELGPDAAFNSILEIRRSP
jgi:hypothetical protein